MLFTLFPKALYLYDLDFYLIFIFLGFMNILIDFKNSVCYNVDVHL